MSILLTALNKVMLIVSGQDANHLIDNEVS